MEVVRAAVEAAAVELALAVAVIKEVARVEVVAARLYGGERCSASFCYRLERGESLRRSCKTKDLGVVRIKTPLFQCSRREGVLPYATCELDWDVEVRQRFPRPPGDSGGFAYSLAFS